ncbi:hypothetical protein MRB53_025125 [Persea americana]|uniref:Uncharacterized protein n=1 Tax=Persea americana TaxID=3435 RepID=A0ACC2LFD1_PERAE|nr:hypothetical protein MRB53_025125 [Persea americana]
MPVISQPPNVVREELQHEQSTTATRISSPIPPSTLSSDSAPVQSEARPVEYVLLTNVQPPSEVSVDVSHVDREMVPPSPPPIVQMEVEETLRVEVPPPTPTIPERVEKVPILEESVPTPFVHEEIAGSTETIPVEEHPPIVQEGLGLIVINATANVQSQPKETSKARSSMQRERGTIQLPFIESSDTLVQGRTMYSSINNEEALTEEPPAAIDVEVTTSEPLVQSSEVQDQSPLEPLMRSEVRDSSDNTVAPELLLILDSSIEMDRTWAVVDETTQALDLEARVICTRANNFLGEQSGLVMDEPNIEMETSLIPCNFFGLLYPSLVFRMSKYTFVYIAGEGTSFATSMAMEENIYEVDLSVVLQTPDDASFELAPLPVFLREQKDCIKMMLIGITQTLTNGRLDQLSNCRLVARNIFGMDWAPLDIRPLRTAVDGLFIYLENPLELCSLSPTALFEQVEKRLATLQTQLKARH